MPKAWEGFFETADWIVYAVALTLVFLVFVMRAYTIPTGSMADSLHGAHFRIRCTQCGFRYDYEFYRNEHKIAGNKTPSGKYAVTPGPVQCPSCGFYHQSIEKDPYRDRYYTKDFYASVRKGDRIFVYKSIYQFFEPKRWDVIVFNPPLQPKINYIKRLVALPGETVQIIDGDVYIDNEIARKPGRVQDDLWMPVFDNDYQPARPEIPAFNGHAWSQPFVNSEGSGWDVSGQGGTVFSLEGAIGKTDTLVYDTTIGNDFKATYAYDFQPMRDKIPICSDLRIRFNVDIANESIIGAELTKFGVRYRGGVDSTGKMIIGKSTGDPSPHLLAEANIDVASGIKEFSFTNVDHELILKFGDQELRYDLGRGKSDAGEIVESMSEVSIFGSGNVKLSHIKIDKDKYYYNKTRAMRKTSKNGKEVVEGYYRDILRAGANSPFTLGDDEFFVLGDNSPASLDCRLWSEPGKRNGGKTYRTGVVPRDYLIGKAFVVFWPGGYKFFDKFPFSLMPYVKGMKPIAGGAY